MRYRIPANPGGLVYGTILIATLLAAEPPRRETYARTVGAVVVAMIVYWLAVSYAEFTGERVRHEEGFTLANFARSAVHELTVVYGAVACVLALAGKSNMSKGVPPVPEQTVETVREDVQVAKQRAQEGRR